MLNTDIASGHLDEGPCPAEVNGGEFDAWKQQGDIKAAFFGHDHNNDFAARIMALIWCIRAESDFIFTVTDLSTGRAL